MSIQTISAKAFASNSATKTVVDLRTSAETQNEALPNCIYLPVQDLSLVSFNASLDKVGHDGGPVYLLCQSGKRAEMAVAKLQGKTERPLVIIEGRLNALKLHGVQVQSGARKTICLERQVRIAAGILVVFGIVLSLFINPYYLALSAFVGAGLIFAGVTDTCGMAICLARMPWNKA